MADNDVTTDVSNVVVYFDVNTGNLYNANGDLYGNNTLSTFLDNNFTLELHYVKDTTISSDPTQWEKWDGLDGQSVSSTLAFDNDFIHAVEGTATEDTTAAATKLSVNVPNINKDTLATSGILVIDPFNSYIQDIPTEDKIVSYSSFEYITGTTFSFTLEDSDGLPFDVAANTPVRVADPVYILVNSNEIYEKNIPEQYAEGIFNIPIHAISKKLLKALDYSNSSGVTGTMEHKIYVNRQSLAGVSLTTGQYSDVTMTRSKDGDTVAQDVAYYAWTYNDGTTRLYYTKNKIPVLNEKVYKKTDDDRIIEANGSVVSDSSTASETIIKIGTGTSVTCPKATGSDEYAPYLFCYWAGDKNGTSVTCYTKGNDISVGSLTYTISEGVATETANTVDPVFDTGYVLHRTFSFPFIVKNLIDYNVSLNIPVENTDWVRAYVISIVKTNMEEIVARASTAAFGVVKIGTNIDVSNGVISVKTASTSNKGLVAIGTNIDVNGGTISVKDASTDDKGLIEIATSAEVTAGESAVLAVTPATLKTELDKKQANLSTNNPLSIDASTVSLNYDEVLVLTDDNELTVRNASNDEIGVVYTASSIRSVDDGEAVSTTENYVPTVGAVESALFTKQDNMSAVEPVVLNASTVSLNYDAPLYKNGSNLALDIGDGLAIGVTGTNANKLITDNATVKNLVEDVTPIDTKVATPKNLKSALSVGKAVDVTSEPYANIGTLAYATEGDIRGIINYTGVSGTAKIGWYDTTDHAFPKFVPTLAYILMADIKNTSSGNASVTLELPSSGATALNNTIPVTLAYNASARVALVFTAKDTGYITFTSTANTKLQITNLREFEVTGCLADARSYIAQIVNPDDHTKFYLVDYDEQNPWTKYIDMQDSSAVTLMSGLAYKLNARSGTHTITTDICPFNYYGKDSHLKLFVGDTANIIFKSPLNLINALTPNAGHNITIKYRDGQANAYVDDTNVGYIVTVNSGETNGSLYYGLTVADTGEYLSFSETTNGVPINIEGGTEAVYPRTPKTLNIIGNGADNTIITAPASTFSKRISQNNGQTLSVNGICFTGYKALAVGAGGIIEGAYNASAHISNCVFKDNIVWYPGIFACVAGLSTAYFFNCSFIDNAVISGNTSNYTGVSVRVAAGNSTTLTLDSCSFINHVNTKWCEAMVASGAVLVIKDCYWDISNTVSVDTQSDSTTTITGSTFNSGKIRLSYSSGKVVFSGRNIINTTIGDAGSIDFMSDSELDISGNTNTITAVGSTITAISGAQIIPYGETEPVVVEGTGNVLLNNGKLGYLVSVASGTTASNTLYDALVGGGTAYSNVVFNPALDESTVHISGGAYNNVYRGVSIIGNGCDKTTIELGSLSLSNQFLYTDTSHTCTLRDMSLDGFTSWATGCTLIVENCLLENLSGHRCVISTLYNAVVEYIRGTTISNCTSISTNIGVICNVSGKLEVSDCLFTANTGLPALAIGGYTTNNKVTNTVFSNNTSGGIEVYAQLNGVLTGITNCLFTGNTNFGVRLSQGAAKYPYVTITGCTFATATDNIKINRESSICTFSGTNILNSTVSGVGTAVFADGATVTSTIPSGSTIGTGVISCPLVFNTANSTIDFSNISISGITTTENIIGPTANNVILNFNNCVFANNTRAGSAPASKWLFFAYGNQVISLTNCTAMQEGNSGAAYAYSAPIYITDSSIRWAVAYTGGTIIVSGRCTVYRFVANGGAGKMVIVPGSTVTTTICDVLTGGCLYYVGNYDAATNTVTTTGTATVILDGTTVSISGSGTTIDSTGLHS